MATEFDEQLKQRLLAFQHNHGLVTDGVAGAQTWSKLTTAGTGTTTVSDPVAETGQATQRGEPGAGRGAGGPAASRTCSCVPAEGQGAQADAGEPPELAGVLEEGDESEAAESALDSGEVELQARRRRRRPPAHPIPAACRDVARACYSKSQGIAWLIGPGRTVVAAVPASGGRPGNETPTGQFRVHFHDRDHYSSTHHHAPMPFYVNFTDQIGFHAGVVGVGSFGCVHLSRSNAERFFNYLRDNDKVDVVD